MNRSSVKLKQTGSILCDPIYGITKIYLISLRASHMQGLTILFQTVVTAAHCVGANHPANLIRTSYVTAGHINRDGDNDIGYQKRSIKNIIRHPDYTVISTTRGTLKDMYHDIAILQLKTPFDTALFSEQTWKGTPRDRRRKTRNTYLESP